MTFFGFGITKRLLSVLMRQNFSKECESALNRQINMELSACHNYLAMAYYFNRSDQIMPGLFAFFKAASDEERGHAEKIMEYMNKRGGQIVLSEIPAPPMQYQSAKEALCTALKWELDVNQSLLDIHTLASEQNDPSLCDFLTANFLQEQVDTQKQLADYIKQLDRCENQLGIYIFDQSFQKGHKNGGSIK